MDNSFGNLIDSAKSILILLPQKPYFDQVAAALALYLSLKGKKEAVVSCPTPMMVEFSRLVGVNKIVQELGSKNLTLRVKDYDAENIEKVSYDIDNGEFKLSIVPKVGLPAPQKEQVEFNYSGVNADMVILVGGGSESHFPAICGNDLVGAKIIHLGTRGVSFAPEKQVMSFARPASSTSEIVTTLIEQSGFEIDPDIATNLLSGIEEGSNKFTSDEVTAETFEILAKLLRAGGRRISKERLVRENFPQGSVPGDIKFEKPEEKDATPKDWLEPKIYKGNTVS
jgi:hypothetical protein